MAMRKSPIELFYLARVELGGQGLMGLVSASHYHDATGFTIEPVDNAGAEIIAADGRERAKVMEQSVDKGSVSMTCAGVHYHTGGFIHHDDVFILIQNLEWEFFRFGLQRREVGGSKTDGVSRT
jgi:hypothetical protein